MLTLCLYDLIYLITSVLMFAVPLLYPLVVMNIAFTFSVPFLLPIAQDIVDGRELLNLAFVANLFNKYPALDLDYVDESKIEETREEKSKFKYSYAG